MKPGNLSERKRCQIRRQTKDEDSIYAHRIFGVRFFILGTARTDCEIKRKEISCNGKKTVYF